MKRFQITYFDCDEIQTWNCKAYDANHAYDKFWDMIHDFGGPEGIRFQSIKRRKGDA